MNIEIKPFESRYLDNFVYNGIERQYMASDEKIRETIFQNSTVPGLTHMGLYNEEVIYFAGVHLLSDHVGEGWMYLNKISREMTFSLVSSVSELIDFYIDRLDLRRFQALSLPFRKTEKLLKTLGFKKEAVLHKYLNGVLDIFVYVILVED